LPLTENRFLQDVLGFPSAGHICWRLREADITGQTITCRSAVLSKLSTTGLKIGGRQSALFDVL